MKRDWSMCMKNKSGFKGFGVKEEDRSKKVDITFNGE